MIPCALIGFGSLGRIVAEHLRDDRDVRFVAVAARVHQAKSVHAVLGDAPLVESPAALLDVACLTTCPATIPCNPHRV